jgi:hypothetical protein
MHGLTEEKMCHVRLRAIPPVRTQRLGDWYEGKVGAKRVGLRVSFVYLLRFATQAAAVGVILPVGAPIEK